MSKLKFYRELIYAVVPVKRYSTDNGIYISNDFTRYLHGKSQSIKQIGVGYHHHNSVAENSINTVVRLSRTIIICAAQSCPDVSYNNLCSMVMYHDVHFHNQNPHIFSGLSPEKVWTSYKYSYYALHNYHQWGCPEYFL